MIATIAAALLSAAIPEGAARYRVELSGEAIGVAELSVRCDGERCLLAWATALRAPEEAGGAVRRRRVTSWVDRAGRLVGAVAVAEDGAARRGWAARGRVPATAAELALLGAALPACVEAFDEETGRAGRACARRGGEGVWIAAEVLGEREELLAAPDGFPAEVRVPEQGVRFRRDPGAGVPARPPRLAVRVPGPADPSAARRFCGLAPDAPAADAVPPAAPAPRATGQGCRAQAEAWVAEAGRKGLAARTAVGVAHDGKSFVWHAWTEVRARGGWIAVDPAFGEAPARGPRFTLGRYAEGDGAGRAEAGRRIVSCWGRSRVE